MIPLANTQASLPTKERILQTCVRLFLEKGYKNTTMSEILHQSGVSNSSFQNLFRTKDGVLLELVGVMFSGQFRMARASTVSLPPVYVYAAETAIQLTLTELNENLREIYIQAYSQPRIRETILRQTASELEQIFGPYLPGLGLEDFYRLDIGSAGLMWGYMARPCDDSFPLEQKLRCFLRLSLGGYGVGQEEIQAVIGFIDGLDIRPIAQQVMQELLQSLQMRFSFCLPRNTPEQPTQITHKEVLP